ncbi:MAG TPA: hypothetical protein VGK87_06605, partial [Anaerolineae bacterium]
MLPGESYYGLINLGDTTNQKSIAQVLVNIDRIASEVVKTVSPVLAPTGGRATYTITIQNQEALAHTFEVTDVLPAGLTFVPGSLSGPNATYDAGLNAVIVNASMPSLVKSTNYAIADSINTPAIVNDSPLGGYYDLQNYTGSPPGARADDTTFVSSVGCGYDFYDSANVLTSTFSYNTNGVFGPRSLLAPTPGGTPIPIPSTTSTLGFISGVWHDMSITNTSGMTDTGRFAFRLAAGTFVCPTNGLWAMEFKRLHRKSDTSSFLDAQYLYDFAVPDVHWVQYGNISGTFGSAAGDVVGAQNFDGTIGVSYNGPIAEGLVLKYYRPMVPPPPVNITFQVTVTAVGPT